MVSWSVINAGDRCGDYGYWNYIFKKKRFSVGGVSMYIELKNVSKKIKGIISYIEVAARIIKCCRRLLETVTFQGKGMVSYDSGVVNR